MAGVKRKSILFLTLYPEPAASPRYRVTQFLPHLEQSGFQCTVAAPFSEREFARLASPGSRPFFYHMTELRRRIAQILSAGPYDIVFLQKAIMSAYVPGLPSLLRSRAKRLVYDFDDAVHLSPPHPLAGVWRFLEDRAQILRIFKMADLVLAGNTWLTEEAREHGANAVCFPTAVDTDRFKPAQEGPDIYRIGWIGNPSTTPHLAAAADALAGLENAEIRLAGADPERVPFDGAEIRPWTFESEVSELQSFSTGIMPLPENDWNKGKCALKALQYMACGIPCVASPFGAALDVIQDGQTGLFARTQEEWAAAFERFRNKEERQRFGERARKHVEENYALRNAAPRMVELLEPLL